MGTSTKLYVSSRWQIEDIKTIIENKFKVEVTVKDCVEISIGMFQFMFTFKQQNRMMSIFSNSETPLGSAIQLNMSYNDDSIIIMETIAGILGGIIQKRDYEETYMMIPGKFIESNALPYFFKRAMLLDKMEDENDLVGLNKYIHEWYDEIKTSRNKMNLFKLEED